MSQLPPHAIDEFQALWKKHYGYELPREQVVVRANQVIALLQAITQPLPDALHGTLPDDPAPMVEDLPPLDDPL